MSLAVGDRAGRGTGAQGQLLTQPGSAEEPQLSTDWSLLRGQSWDMAWGGHRVGGNGPGRF